MTKAFFVRLPGYGEMVGFCLAVSPLHLWNQIHEVARPKDAQFIEVWPGHSFFATDENPGDEAGGWTAAGGAYVRLSRALNEAMQRADNWRRFAVDYNPAIAGPEDNPWLMPWSAPAGVRPVEEWQNSQCNGG